MWTFFIDLLFKNGKEIFSVTKTLLESEINKRTRLWVQAMVAVSGSYLTAEHANLIADYLISTNTPVSNKLALFILGMFIFAKITPNALLHLKTVFIEILNVLLTILKFIVNPKLFFLDLKIYYAESVLSLEKKKQSLKEIKLQTLKVAKSKKK